MRARSRFAPPLVLGFVLVLIAAAPAPAAWAAAQGTTVSRGSRPGPPRARAAHPDTRGDQECRGCHENATPAAYEAWHQGKHGEVLVTCVVCHGSTGADFARRPPADRCNGCHAAQVAAMAQPFMKGKTCFTCHPAHALDPHGARSAVTSRTPHLPATAETSVAFPNQGSGSVPLGIRPTPPPQGSTPAPAPAPAPSGAARAPAEPMAQPGTPPPASQAPAAPSR